MKIIAVLVLLWAFLELTCVLGSQWPELMQAKMNCILAMQFLVMAELGKGGKK